MAEINVADMAKNNCGYYMVTYSLVQNYSNLHQTFSHTPYTLYRNFVALVATFWHRDYNYNGLYNSL